MKALTFENWSVRVVTIDGETWWVLADVCQALELTNTTRTAERLDADELSNTQVVDSAGRKQEVLIVSEPGLYKLIATSNKPVAKRFDRWVRHDVLPSIRKTGTYGSPSLTPPIQIQAISDLFDQKLEPVIRRQDAMDKKLSLVVDNTNEMATKGRKDASAETIRVHGKVIRYHYDKKCPCLECNITIMDDDGFIQYAWHHHHQFDHNNNSPKAMIPLAVECHKRISQDAEARTRFGGDAWKMFQKLLERLPSTQLKMNFE
jgi:prophage antirepressor-like protein